MRRSCPGTEKFEAFAFRLSIRGAPSDSGRQDFHYDDAMALISWNRWLDRFGDAAPVGVLPPGLTFSVRQERRASLKDRRISNQPLPGQESRRTGPTSRRR